jgi:D-alanyl-D-alanine dipeptidase
MYALNRAFLRKGTAVALARAQALIKHTGLRLKIWDAYRPLGVQAAMWRAVADPAFIAPPSRGSHHNRGAAVDVTLVDVFGADVEMPTDFDDFTPAARSDALCSATAATNQEILRRAMLSAGFRGISTEWWHFVDPFWRAYPLCDVTLHQLATLRCSWR